MDRRFRLQTVLNYREDLEEALQLELGRLQGDELIARNRLDALRTEVAGTMNATGALFGGARVDLATIEQGFGYMAALHPPIHAQLAELADLAGRLEAARREAL